MNLTSVLRLSPPFGGSSPTPGAPPRPTALALRDRPILKLIAGLIEGTGEFHRVTTWGPPDVQGVSSEYAKLAGLELAGFEEAVLDDDYYGPEIQRTAGYLLHLYVRDPDPDARDDEIDRLANVCANAVDGVSYGGANVVDLSFLRRGQYQAADAPERRLRMAGQFVYLIPSWATRSTDP